MDKEEVIHLKLEGPRSVKMDEFDSLVEIVNRTFSKGQRRMEKVYPLLFSKDNIENLRVFVDGGKVISHVGMLPRVMNIYGHKIYTGLIGSVCTDPKYRGKGLATQLLNDIEGWALKNGISIFYISGDRNLYKRFGAVNAGIFYTAIVSERKENSEIRKATVEDITKLCKIYSRKPVRFVRHFDDFLVLFKTGYAVDEKANYFIFKDSYAIFVERHSRLEMVEYGGEEKDVLEISKHVLSKSEHDEIILNFPYFSKFKNMMMKKRKRGFLGTVKILSAEMFFNQVKGYLLERLSRRRVEKLKEEIIGMNSTYLTKFFFGSIENDVKVPSDLEGILPIPIPDYGLDYV